MPFLDLGDLSLHYQDLGSKSGAPVVFCNEIGTDSRLWQNLMPLLPAGLRLITHDLRGQGQSSVPPSPYRMGQMIADTEQLLDHLGIRDAVFVGLGLGGLIAQGLATKRLDQIRALVLMGTAPRIGAASHWDRSGLLALAEGIEPIVIELVPRWFSSKFQKNTAFPQWRDVLAEQDPEGFAGAAAAISGTDFYTTTAALTLPAIVIAGYEDRATPPDLLRELSELMPGAEFALLRGAGHLPPIDSPAETAALIGDFLHRIAHPTGTSCQNHHHDGCC